MKRLTRLAVATLLLVSSLSFAFDASLSGTVTNQDNGISIESATVVIGNEEATTDENGHFEFGMVFFADQSPFTIEIFASGYQQYSQEIILEDRDNLIDFQLEPFLLPIPAPQNLEIISDEFPEVSLEWTSAMDNEHEMMEDFTDSVADGFIFDETNAFWQVENDRLHCSTTSITNFYTSISTYYSGRMYCDCSVESQARSTSGSVALLVHGSGLFNENTYQGYVVVSHWMDVLALPNIVIMMMTLCYIGNSTML